MHWAVAAPFTITTEDRWLAPFVPGDAHDFSMVPRLGTEVSWHNLRSRRAGPRDWARHLAQSHEACRIARRTQGGVITVFPQLAATTGLEKRASRGRFPVLAWFFDTEIDTPLRLAASRAALARVDRFVVHTRCEREVFSRILHLPIDRFSFVPLQYGGDIETDPVDEADPFVFTTGSGFRDYPTFFEAIGRLGYRTVVCSGERALAGTAPPPCVEIRNDLTRREIHQMMRRARLNVLPMRTQGITAGGITIVETFRHGRGLVATHRPGLEDYLFDDKNALLVPPGDAGAMASAIEAMWTDPCLRQRLDDGAADFALQLTDEAAGAALGDLLDQLAGR